MLLQSAIIAEVCKLLGVNKSRTTPYHTQFIERFNRMLLDMLYSHHCWRPPIRMGAAPLAFVLSIQNTSLHRTTRHLPFYLMFGCQARMPVDITLITATAPSTTISEYVANLCSSLESVYSYGRNCMGHQLEKQKV